MSRLKRVETRAYRDHAIEILDDHATGWAISIHGAAVSGKAILRCREPNGLIALIDEAKRVIDAAMHEPVDQRTG